MTATDTRYGEQIMNEQNNPEGKPSPERVKVLQHLPKEIVEQLTKEEVKAFLFDDEWPHSLQNKLKDFLE